MYNTAVQTIVLNRKYWNSVSIFEDTTGTVLARNRVESIAT